MIPHLATDPLHKAQSRCVLCKDYELDGCLRRDTPCPYVLSPTENWYPDRIQCGTRIVLEPSRSSTGNPTARFVDIGCAVDPEPPALVAETTQEEVGYAAYAAFFPGAVG